MLFRWIELLIKIIIAMQCQHDLYSLCEKEKRAKGFNWFAEKLDNVIGDVIFFGILSFGIFKGWVRMPPPYLGDGYDFDNFGSEDIVI